MASVQAKTSKMKRMESRKSHSWWWASHISPKNSKWLQENLEEMDQYVKQMLKLIEEDADSFAQRAQMYYQKRPELINLVEEFYRMYRALAERYDHVTGELRKNIPSDLQSQGSGVSDVGSELSTEHDQKPSHGKSVSRAAGFEHFLGTGGSSADMGNKEPDESSTLDSESESDDSSVNDYSSTLSNEAEQTLRRKIMELEAELRNVKEQLQVQKEENSEGLLKKTMEENSKLLSKLAAYEEELRVAKENVQSSQEELRIAKEKVQSSQEELRIIKEKIQSSQEELRIAKEKVQSYQEELRVAKEKIQLSEEEVGRLTNELQRYESMKTCNHVVEENVAKHNVGTWKSSIKWEQYEDLELQPYNAGSKDYNKVVKQSEVLGFFLFEHCYFDLL